MFKANFSTEDALRESATGKGVYIDQRNRTMGNGMSLQIHLYHKIVPFCSVYISAYEIGSSTPIDNLLSILVCLP